MIDDDELVVLEGNVEAALRTADQSGLPLLGEGEIALVLAAGEGGGWACKRLPPFASTSAADRYASTIDRYVAELGRRGIDVLDTSVRRLPATDGRTVLYCVQPVVPSSALAVHVARRDPDAAQRILDGIVDAVEKAVDERFGLDAQLSNWALIDDRLVYFDITTPLLRGADGRPQLDTDVFLASVPWALRPALRRLVVPGIVERYHDPRTVVLDVAANLLKEQLDELVPYVMASTDDRLTPPLTDREIRRDRRNDARTWGALQAVRRADRTWQRRIRRRPYPFLLPTHRHR